MSANNKSGYKVVCVFRETVSDRQAEEEITGLLKEQYLRKLPTEGPLPGPLQSLPAAEKRENAHE